jgi:hypothetical protein
MSSVIMTTFVDLDIVGDRLRLHDGLGTINWGGFDWLGVGQYGGIGGIPESLEVISQPVKLTLSGVDAQYITDAMTTQYHGRAVVIYLGLFNPDTLTLIDTPEEIWSGFMDVMHIELDQGTAVIRLDCEHRLRRQPATARYTDEDQRVLVAGDLFFNKLHLIPGYVAKWGSRDISHDGDGYRPGTPRERTEEQ